MQGRSKGPAGEFLQVLLRGGWEKLPLGMCVYVCVCVREGECVLWWNGALSGLSTCLSPSTLLGSDPVTPKDR